MTTSAAPDSAKAVGQSESARRRRKILEKIGSILQIIRFVLFGGEIPGTNKADELQPPGANNKKVDPVNDRAYIIFGFRFRPHWVLDPSTDRYYHWLVIISIAFLYNLIMIPPRAIWDELEDTQEFIILWFVLDHFCDLLYLIDIILKMITGYLEQGLMVREPRKLFKHYFKSFGSRLDILCLLPTDLLYLVSPVGYHRPWVLVRINRLLKYGRLRECLYRTETRTNYPNAFRMLTLLMTVMLITHINGCIYYAVSEAMGLASDIWVYPGTNIWKVTKKMAKEKCTEHFAKLNQTVTKEEIDSCVKYNRTLTNYGNAHDPLYEKYVGCFYWSMLMMTTIAEIWGPVKINQYGYVTVCLLIGVMIFATILGNVGSMISNMNASRVDFQNRMDGVKHYMEFRKVGKDLENKIIKWFDYLWTNNQTLDEDTVLSSLPDKLRAEIAMHVHLDTLKRVSIFQDVEPGLLAELVLKLKLQVYSPGDYICRKGDTGKEMYIVKRGKLDVVSDDGKIVFVTLTDGSVFGEISILNIVGNKTGNKRTANVRSVGYSDLFCLSKDDLWDALTEYPEAKRKLMDRGKSILMKDNLIDEDVAREAEKHNQNVVDKVDRLDVEVGLAEKRYQRILSEYVASQQKLKKRLTSLEEAVRKRRLRGQHLYEKDPQDPSTRIPEPFSSTVEEKELAYAMDILAQLAD